MFDAASKLAGARIVLATSCDDRYPPENIIDGSDETFWSSTGLFPQEFVLTFTSMMEAKRINLACYNGKISQTPIYANPLSAIRTCEDHTTFIVKGHGQIQPGSSSTYCIYSLIKSSPTANNIDPHQPSHNVPADQVRKIILEKSQTQEPLKFEPLTERVLEKTDRTLQNEEFSLPSGTQMLHLRVLIESGYDHFVSVHKLSVDGSALHG